MTDSSNAIIPAERIYRSIYLIRRQKVILSPDLAQLYNVETRALIQAVKRNIGRFPTDFMFQLSSEEFKNLKSQIVISSWGGARRAQPYAFTEQGVAMLSSVLRSKRAVEVNIAIMRTFVKLREILATNTALRQKIEAIERKYDEQFRQVFALLTQMAEIEQEPKPRIGYLTELKEHRKQSRKK